MTRAVVLGFAAVLLAGMCMAPGWSKGPSASGSISYRGQDYKIVHALAVVKEGDGTRLDIFLFDKVLSPGEGRKILETVVPDTADHCIATIALQWKGDQQPGRDNVGGHSGLWFRGDQEPFAYKLEFMPEFQADPTPEGYVRLTYKGESKARVEAKPSIRFDIHVNCNISRAVEF